MSNKLNKELQNFLHGFGPYAMFAGTSVHHRAPIFLERNIVIPRSELPSVKRAKYDENTYYTDNDNVVFTSAENARMWVMRDVAVWQFIEADEAVESEKNAARDKRRDELASEFTAVNSYNGQLPYTQKLIDRIVDLEQAAK